MGDINMSYKGPFRPKNPQKYKGNPTNIIYRSLWELRMMRYFDITDSVIEWSSEEIIIPYRSPKDNRIHRYFPDFYVKVRGADGTINNMLIEVKPKKQTMLKENASKKEKLTWIVNVAKWKAAELYCQKHNFVFKLLTEKELFSNA